MNLAVLIGAQLRGVGGALIALAGLLLVPLAILLALGGFYFAAHGASLKANAPLKSLTAKLKK